MNQRNPFEMGSEAVEDEILAETAHSFTAKSRGPRLFIKEMVLRNFKSYAGEQRVGPFHKVGFNLNPRVFDLVLIIVEMDDRVFLLLLNYYPIL